MMDDIPESVMSLDATQLRKELLELGVNVGPIPSSASSMKLFQRRLARALSAKTGLDSDNADSTDTNDDSAKDFKDSPVLDSSSDVFFAISLPENIDPQLAREVNQLVFSDRDLAMKTAKKVKGSRFKVFKSQSDAEEFSKLSAEHTSQTPMKVQKQDDTSKEDTISTESIPYKAPKPQELVIVRMAIQKGDARLFLDYVWNNPRYLISSGDTPVIYQEGPRYSAMHISAIKNQPEICREILETLENKQFIRQLYSQSHHTKESLNNRINFLVDLYLNMPDKASCETPLHMACKFGFEEVVKILAAHPKTDKLRKNRYGETPNDIICSRSYDALTSTKTRIAELLQGQYYVPLIRSIDNSTQPMIGQPWSPDINKSPADMNNIPSSPMSPRDPVLSIKACAGPMSPSFASNFHKKWTTPPSDSAEKTKLYLDTKRGDSEKGMERIGRYLAHEMQIPWIEHWDFLDSYVDLSTIEGLDILEEYFKKTTWYRFIKDFKERHGLEELYQDIRDLSSSVKAVGCDNIESAETVGSNCYGSELERKERSEKNLSASKNLSKLFDDSTTDIQASPLGTMYDKGDKSVGEGEGNGKDIPGARENNVSETKNGKADDNATTNEESCKSNTLDIASSTNNKSHKNNGSPTNRNECQLVSNIVSPMTSLSQSFAQLTVLDDSWDDKVNNNSSDSASAASNLESRSSNHGKNYSDPILDSKDKENPKINYENEANADKNSTAEGESEGLTGDALTCEVQEHKTALIEETDNAALQENSQHIDLGKFKYTNNNIERNRPEESNGQETLLHNASGAKTATITLTEKADTDASKDTADKHIKDKVDAADELLTGLTVSASDTVGTDKTEVDIESGEFVKDGDSQTVTPDNKISAIGRQHLLSERSDSSSSYKTAESEDYYDCNVMSPFSDISSVGLRLMYSQSIDAFKEEIDRRNKQFSELESELVYLLVRLKNLPANGLMKVDVVVYPMIDSVIQLMLFENLEVMSCEGNLSGVAEGEVIDVIFTHRNTEVKLKAHFTREDCLPQAQYIHGAEPTKDDLDVSRALGTTTVLPGNHPNIFHWKTSLDRFCSDRKYRWQSPAKLKTTLRQSSTPNATPQRKKIPTIPYGSPIGYECEDRKNLVTSDLRTALFPAIYE